MAIVDWLLSSATFLNGRSTIQVLVSVDSTDIDRAGHLAADAAFLSPIRVVTSGRIVGVVSGRKRSETTLRTSRFAVEEGTRTLRWDVARHSDIDLRLEATEG